ncbi:hypothetical protein U2F26_31775 [Micromonospora sp. 4G57]|uniref:Uncharacterized protein n=1 Tax=Micromonospora sicca TaxID=2202420 RepID=A0ABU5JNI7_9ACTN|nr:MULTISPECIES: hypothetical protein [unclassified Micromonospora]MDZ5447238.1 hypothetical protein [Micromonospora sp. 4G57]MDZ5493934.1 hypothetical protein [Micromonospora sp. 4G53]
MDDVVRRTFFRAMPCVSDELSRMPLSGWNESVFRYFFCRSLSEAHPDVTQFVECDRIDLVLHRAEEKAFIEFKFYLRAPKFDPYTGRRSGLKGGPGPRNLDEFRRCVDQLHGRKPVHGLSKYIVLVYADPIGGSTTANRYSTHYDDYAHWNEKISLDPMPFR